MHPLTRLEDTVERTMRSLVYLVTIIGIIVGEIYIYSLCEITRYVRHWGENGPELLEKEFSTGWFIIGTIGVLLGAYIVWCYMMFAVNIGINIKKIRKILEEKTQTQQLHEQ